MNERSSTRRPPALWLFGLLRVPYGIFTGFVKIPLPYLLRAEGLPVDRVANIVAVVALPAVFYFLWSPLADFWLRRRSWLMLAASLSAVSLFVVLTMPAMTGNAAIGLITLGFSVNLLVSSASGGLVATELSGVERTKVSGWYQAGNLGAGALGGGLILLASEHFPKQQVAWMAALLVAAPAMASLLIGEQTPDRPWGQLKLVTSQMIREARATFFSRNNLITVSLILAPIGTGAAAPLFSAMAQDYQVNATQVGWLSGIGGGLMLALGALLGGFMPVRWNRGAAYVGAGALNAVSAALLCVAPLTPFFYFIGLTLYQLTTGLCYASFAALVFQLLGNPGRSASTRYTLAISLSNIPIVYMTWLEGFSHRSFGLRSVAGMDAAGNILVGLIFLTYWMIDRSKGKCWAPNSV